MNCGHCHVGPIGVHVVTSLITCAECGRVVTIAEALTYKRMHQTFAETLAIWQTVPLPKLPPPKKAKHG
jgi:hypothetical protein